MYDKAIKINPKFAAAYNNKGLNFYHFFFKGMSLDSL